ncbi:putative ArsR family transcriptional regulator [Caulobacter ginsengisoli]|uniref:ArsR family transcriptional regulator n=1 Tax=Caulobacter ginsengisoli TaxID=400775 RepID=A0ABU0IW74_9CAUL|nr:HTH domain-containing protein [Caulobacter ginsengisoli]MDQ0465601.1 putative ArsR family transcriptional regulator [Caulobacter ginsengisoli]
MLEVIGQRQQALLHLLLERKQGLTVDQMAAALGITRTAVREHVAALERDRLIAPGQALPSTGGRPGRRYVLTPRGHALFPKQYDLMARLLLESLARQLGGGPAVEAELAELGARLAADLKGRIGGATLAERAGATALLMRELGYEATAGGGETPEIEAFNCVYHELAQKDRAVCALDLALIGGLAEAEVEHRACMARGDDSCRFCLKPR